MVFEKKKALSVFYYLIAIDGYVTDSEIETYTSVCRELDPMFFDQYSGEISSSYCEHIQTMIEDEDFYDVIIEGVDKALASPLEEGTDGISSRLLLWNLLVVAFADGEYTSLKRRLIKHIVRTKEIGKEVFLEMEQLMKANVAVTKELETLGRSEKPYTEIRPIIDELEGRRTVIVNSAKALIEDELYVPVNKVEIEKNQFFEDTKDKVSQVAGTVVGTMSPITNGIGDQSKKIIGNLMTKNPFNKQ